MKDKSNSLDLTGKKLIAMRDAEVAKGAGACRIEIASGTILTPSAREFLAHNNIAVETRSCAAAAQTNGSAAVSTASTLPSGGRPAPNPQLFYTPEAEAVKKEICAVGQKLWMRQFVDGNGGNISYRIGPNEVICTPTLVSKFDLKPEDLSLVDLEGNQIAGTRPRTSEIFLHLEIYKAVPEAKGVVHCHPPHATAYAITGRVPPNLVVPEFEVFVGKVALSPYETPGTAKFAQTVLPFVKTHNTVLLANHGIVCWADTVTHAEWYAEVLETYCWTLMIASQLGAPISFISEQKGADLLALKKRLGLPDSRFDGSGIRECQLSELEMPNSIALVPNSCEKRHPAGADAGVESLVKAVTDAVMERWGNSGYSK